MEEIFKIIEVGGKVNDEANEAKTSDLKPLSKEVELKEVYKGGQTQFPGGDKTPVTVKVDDTPCKDDHVSVQNLTHKEKIMAPKEDDNHEENESCVHNGSPTSNCKTSQMCITPSESGVFKELVETELTNDLEAETLKAVPKKVTTKHRCRNFDIAFKVKVIEYAENSSNRGAGRAFGVDAKRVREWRKKKKQLQRSPESKKMVEGCLVKMEVQPEKVLKRNYEASFKMAVIEFAEHNSNRSTGRQFGIDEKQVREWRKQKEELEGLPPGKKRLSGAGRKPAFPNMEKKLVAWIEAQKADKMKLTRTDIQTKAVELCGATGESLQFTASHGWLDNFFRRKHISLRH